MHQYSTLRWAEEELIAVARNRGLNGVPWGPPRGPTSFSSANELCIANDLYLALSAALRRVVPKAVLVQMAQAIVFSSSAPPAEAPASERLRQRRQGGGRR